jgi:ABC-type multidrug transport system permease subunit
VVNFFRAMLLIVLITFAGGSFGMLLGVVAPTVEAGFAMLPAILLPNSMVAGLMVNLDTVPNWFVPKWTSTFRYGFEGLVQNEFDDLPDVDSRVSDHLIDLMNFKFEYWWDVLLLFVIGLAFRILALILINVKNRRKPNKFK